MGHPSLKKRSKRMSCRTRYKIDKKVREHNRKKKREAKKHPHKGSKVDLVVVPNLCPFKEQAIEELNVAKAREKEILKNNLVNQNQEESISLEKFVRDAQNKENAFLLTNFARENEKILFKKIEKVSLVREFRKVVATADIILEVVDARDPIGTRCKIVEQTVLQSPEKRLVIVINKADLVPRNVLEHWLKYLRKSWPTVPFKASVQEQSQKLGRRAMIKKSGKKRALEKLTSVSSCVGAEFLIRLLANYRRNKGVMTSITVGVVGVPNVGKSSVINSLKRTKSCRVGAEPGVTKTLQVVRIGAGIEILDSPGIVMENSKDNTSSCLKNLVRSDHLTDPVSAAQAILVRITKEEVLSLYQVCDYNTPEEFLLLLAKRCGLIGKKGIPDTTKAAKKLVQDWNRGKIKFHSLPPEENTDNFISAEIVLEHSQEFGFSEVCMEEELSKYNN